MRYVYLEKSCDQIIFSKPSAVKQHKYLTPHFVNCEDYDDRMRYSQMTCSFRLPFWETWAVVQHITNDGKLKATDGPRVSHLETIRQEKTTREIRQAAKRRPGQILEIHDMAEDSTRQVSLTGAC